MSLTFLSGVGSSSRSSVLNPLKFDRAEWLCFIVGALSFLSIPIGGRLTVSEILIFLSFFLVFRMKYVLENKLIRFFLILAGIYLCSQVVTDFIRDTPSKDAVRGVAKVAVFIVCLVWMACVFRGSPRRYAALAIGGAMAGILKLGLSVGFSYNTTLFKFGYGPVGAFLIVATGFLLAPRFKALTISLVLVAFGIFSFFMNARSLAGVCLFAGLASTVFLGPGGGAFRRLPLLVKVGGLALGALCVYGLYVTGASSGAFGDEAARKLAMQAREGDNVFSSSRGETAASIPAIIDSPLIGHGSWAKNPKYVVLFLRSIGADLNSYNSREQIYRGLIPSHSHFFGAWVEAGLAGGLFWGTVFFFVGITLVRLTSAPPGIILPFAMLVGIGFMWDIIFSPFGLDRRMNNAATIVFFVIIADQLRLWQQQQRARRMAKRADLDVSSPAPAAA